MSVSPPGFYCMETTFTFRYYAAQVRQVLHHYHVVFLPLPRARWLIAIGCHIMHSCRLALQQLCTHNPLSSPYDHQYLPGNTRIYAYGPHYYSDNTQLVSHEKFRHFGAKFTPYEHQYCQSNTHILAYGPHYYSGNTHAKLVSHKICRQFCAKFTPI